MSPTIKKLLSIAFFASLVFFGAKVFRVEVAECAIVFRAHEAAGEVQGLSAQLYEDDENEILGSFTQRGASAVTFRWPMQLAAGSYRVEFEYRQGGKLHHLEQDVELEDGNDSIVHLGK